MTFPFKLTSLSIFASIAVGSLVMSPAQAGALSTATILQDFNAVVYTNGSTSADIEGATVIGGNFSGATMYNHPTQSQPTGYGALTVFGNTSGSGMNINNGGNAYVGGAKNGNISFNGGGYIGSPGSTIADFETSLNALSGNLAQLKANNTFTVGNGNNGDAFNATTTSNGIAVFDVTSAQLGAMNSYQINLDGASTIIINVSGSSVDISANLTGGLAAADNVIWNFYQASNVTLQTQFEGTVLATGATVINDNQIDGTLVANAWTGQGELHDYGFTGTLPPPSATTPEPAAFTLLGGGMMSLMLVLARRKSRARTLPV